MSKPKKEQAAIMLTSHQACGLAIPAMLREQQPKITVSDEGENIVVYAEFAADQDFMLKLQDDLLVGGSVTFKIGRQPTTAALAALEQSNFMPLVFDLTTLGEGSLKTCHLDSAKLPLSLAELNESGADLLADVLTRLMATDVVHDGKTDHFEKVQQVLQPRHRVEPLVEPGGVGALQHDAGVPHSAHMEAAINRGPSHIYGDVPYGHGCQSQMGD